MISLFRLKFFAVIATALVCSYGAGRIHQNSIHKQNILKAEIAAFERAEQLSAELIKAEKELHVKQQKLEEAAHADRNNVGVCLPTSRVRRLNLH